MVRIIEYIAGHYDVQEVEFGRVYRWRTGRVVIECDCGRRSILTGSATTCRGCGAEHAALVREEVVVRGLEKEAEKRPWRSWLSSGETGIPF